MKRCPDCGKENVEEVKFCIFCGTSLDSLRPKTDESTLPPSSRWKTDDLQGWGLGKAFTVINSRKQTVKYVLIGLVFSAMGFFVASIPLGTATLVVGRVLLRNRVRTWGYLFCMVGTLWAVGLPILNLISLIQTESVGIIPQWPKFQGG